MDNDELANLIKNTYNSLSSEQREKFDSIQDPYKKSALMKEIIGIRGAGYGEISEPSTPEEQMEGIKRIGGNFIGETALGVVEGATLGLPRMAVKAATGYEIPRGNVIGQMAGFAIPTTEIYNVVGRTGKIISKPIVSAIRSELGRELFKRGANILGGTVSGSISGFAYPQEGLDIPQRTVGAIGGSILGLGGTSLSESYKLFRDIGKIRGRINSIDAELRNLPLSPLKNEPQKYKDEMTRMTNLKTKLLNTEKNWYSKSVQSIKESIEKESQTNAQSIKQPILKFVRDFRDDWGLRLDEALSNATEQGVTKSELNSIISETIDGLVEQGVNPNSPTLKIIGNTAKKIKKENLTNRELLQLKQTLSKNLSNSGKRTGQFTEDDIAIVELNKNLVNRLKENVPEWSKLSKDYSDFSDLTRFAFKRFSPRSSEYQISGGSSLLRRIAAEGGSKGYKALNEGERKALEMIKEKTGFDFMSSLKKRGNDLVKEADKFASRKNIIETVVSERINELSKLKASSVEKGIKFKIGLQNEKAALEETRTILRHIRTAGLFSGGFLAGGYYGLRKLISGRGSNVGQQ